MKSSYRVALSKIAKKRSVIFLAVFLSLLMVLHFCHPIWFAEEEQVSPTHSDILNNELTLVQPFTLKRTSSSISFCIATFMQEINTGKLTVEITDTATGEQNAMQVFDASHLGDNQVIELPVELKPGHYMMSLDFDGLEEGKSVVVYNAHSPTHELCSINGNQQSYEIGMNIHFKPDLEALKRTFLMLSSGILAVFGISLVISVHRRFRNNPENKRKTIARNAIAFACLGIAVILLYISFQEIIDNGKVNYLKNKRELFYFIVALLAICLYLVSSESPWSAWLLMAMIGCVWIFTDLKYNIIDEGAHTEIIQYILKNKWAFPLASENYEAVQGPVYYYVAALVTGWLPMKYLYIGARVLGLFFLMLFGWISYKTLDEVKRAGWYRGSDTLLNLLWLLLMINPKILICFTRVSNEPLVSVLSAAAVLLTIRMFVQGFDSRKIFMATASCALAFLTKATSAPLVVLIFMVCAYYKKWKELFLSAGLYLIIVVPWFIDNIYRYGALTGMQQHLDVVLPIVNPEMTMPDIREDLIYYFRSYFWDSAPGIWYDYNLFDNFVFPLMSLMLIFAIIVSIQHLFQSLRNRLMFKYDSEEKKKTLFLTFTILPVASLAMHTIQTIMTLNDSLRPNRYCLLMNGVFCALTLIGLSSVSERYKKIIAGIVAAFFSFIMLSMIGGYTEIAVTYYLSL